MYCLVSNHKYQLRLTLTPAQSSLISSRYISFNLSPNGSRKFYEQFIKFLNNYDKFRFGKIKGSHFCAKLKLNLYGLCGGLPYPKLRFMVGDNKTRQDKKIICRNRGYLSLDSGRTQDKYFYPRYDPNKKFSNIIIHL